MGKTFNLKTFIQKQANLDSEGAQGYFLAQSRAWMNCSKCKRNDGKTAQQAWQECFEEFQKGDRKLSWLESYAKAATKGISKEAAIDYSGEIDILVSDGVPMQEAVMGAIKTAQAKWWEKLRDATPFGRGQREVRRVERERVKNPAIERQQQPRNLKLDGQTYNQLVYIQKLISNNEFDSGSIKRLVLGIQDEQVQKQLNQFVNYIEQTEASFAAQIDKMSEAATKMINTYQKKRLFYDPEDDVVSGWQPFTGTEGSAPANDPQNPPKSHPIESQPAVPSSGQPLGHSGTPPKTRPNSRQASRFNQSSGFNIVSHNKVADNIDTYPAKGLVGQPNKTHPQIENESGSWRKCNKHDLIIVSEGLQCGNCGGVTSDHGKTWKATPGFRRKQR